MERNPERYKDIIDTKPASSKSGADGKTSDRSAKRKASLSKSSRSRSRSESRHRRPTPAVIPRVRLRSSSGEEEEEEEDEKDVREKEKEDENEIQTLKLLKSGLAEKAKETLEKKLSKVSPDVRSQEKPGFKDERQKTSDVKEEKLMKPLAVTTDGASVSDIALPEKEPKNKGNEKTITEKPVVNIVLPSSPPPSQLPLPSKSPEHPPPIQPSAIPKPPGSPPVRKDLETEKNNSDDTTEISKKDTDVSESGSINQKRPHSPGLEALRRRQQSNSSSRSRSRSRSESRGHSKSSPKSRKSRSSSQSSYSRRYVL
jgi:hypothetical protein